MKAPLFEFPSFQYEIKDWEFKKKGLIKRIKEEKFYRTPLQTFETDRQTSNKSYLHYFQIEFQNPTNFSTQDCNKVKQKVLFDLYENQIFLQVLHN
jgi:hypothetical protein